jgi:amino acid adenylation domain-containing protein
MNAPAQDELLRRWLNDDRARAGRITPRAGDGPAVASSRQRRLWLIDQLAPGNAAYNIHEALRIRGPLDVDVLVGAVRTIVARHDSLRTTLRDGDELVQDVTSPGEFDVEVTTLTGSAAAEVALRATATAEAGAPFDLARGPLFRARLLRLAPDHHVLLLTAHHTVSDGWSVVLIKAELAELYEAGIDGRRPCLPELPVQYADFAEWQCHQQPDEAKVDYWRRHLLDLPTALELPTDRPRPPVQSLAGRKLWFSLEAPAMERLRDVCRDAGMTTFTGLFAVFEILLCRYSGSQDIVTGTVMANRERVETENLVGFFANTVAVRTDLSGDPDFGELLARVGRALNGAHANQDVPFEHLVEELQPERDPGKSPLFQVMFTMQSAGTDGARLHGLEVEHIPTDNRTAAFDIAVALEEKQDGSVAGWLTYATALFDESTIRRLIDHYTVLVTAAGDRPASPISGYSLLTDAERDTLLEWNRTGHEYPEGQLIQEFVDRQAASTPDKVAVESDDGWLTFAELVVRANQLAHYLRRRGVGPEVAVALMTERTLDMVVAQLGVLKAGGAYVPLDPTYPTERLAYILRDTGARVIIVESAVAASVPTTDAEIVVIDQKRPSIAWEPVTAPRTDAVAANLAQIYYTSGSTGTPKGVLLSHEGWSNVITWHGRYFAVTARDRVAQVGAVAFDVCAWELWINLAAGATVCIPSEEVRISPERLLAWMAEKRITITWVPAVLAEQVLELPLPDDLRLRWLASGGDRLRRRPGKRLPFRFFNMYGPTEITVMCTSGPVSADGKRLPSIGYSISNSRLHVLDELGNPVPPGMAGELYIGGVGLARGYLGRPGQTAERFVPDPFSGRPGARLYRTGDIVRHAFDGAIEFIGRTDHQVKIRGLRVELGEIEAVLNGEPGVAQCCVVLRDTTIIAYVVREHDGVSEAQLARRAAAQLPGYMVPSVFLFLDALPVNAFDKVDRAALPDPGRVRRPASVTARTETEATLSRIWSEVLDVPDVDIDENFFAAGGNSLAAVRTIGRIRSEFDPDTPLRALFLEPTVRRLGAWLDGRTTLKE